MNQNPKQMNCPVNGPYWAEPISNLKLLSSFGCTLIPAWAYGRPGETRDYANGPLTVAFDKHDDDPDAREDLIDQGNQWEVLVTLTGPQHDINRKLSGDAIRSFEGFDASTYQRWAETKTEWLVDDVIEAGEPMVIGGASKTNKTGLALDLAVSLATRNPWLGQFNIPEQKRVLFVTGESNAKSIARRLTKCLTAKGLSFTDTMNFLRIEVVQFPKLASEKDRLRLAFTVQRFGTEVVILDPLYRGLGGLDTSMVADVGDAIVSMNQAVKPATLIISHHSTKASAGRERYGKPLSLENLSGAGVAESFGQWWLISRESEYKMDGQHNLICSYGGRGEQAGLCLVEFDELRWKFDVHNWSDWKADKVEQREVRKLVAADLDQQEVIRILNNSIEPMTKTGIKTASKTSKARVEKALDTLVQSGQVETLKFKGGGNGRTVAGYKLKAE
jgi:hypothetical protein